MISKSLLLTGCLKYRIQLTTSKCRSALVQDAMRSQQSAFGDFPVRFEKQSDVALARALTECQKSVAKLQPRLSEIDALLKVGDADRSAEMSLRWQAGFDLAKGQALAARVRAESYNVMLALAKRGLRFKDPKNDTWVLEPSNEVPGGPAMAKMAVTAKKQLEKVVMEHPGTPWAPCRQARTGKSAQLALEGNSE